MSRLLLLPILFCIAIGALLPRQAVAAGTPLKGILISNQGEGMGSTGDCLCEWKWYTVGANPGKLTISARMSTPRQEFASIWEMRMVVLHGADVVSSKSVTCRSTQKICQPLAKITVHVRHRAIFYIRMEGFAAGQIPFILRVVGPVVPLHCTNGKC